jgi:hypothetical protein
MNIMLRILVIALFCGLIFVDGGASSSSAVSAPIPSPTPTVMPITIGDTALDISHAVIVASIIGCNIHTDDLVLVNGIPANGVLWDRPHIVPKGNETVTPVESRLLEGLNQKPPEILPTVSFRLKPGYYNFALSVGRCSSKPFPLVAADFFGYRHISVIMTPSPVEESSKVAIGGTPADSTGVFGDIPLSDLQVVLSDDDSKSFYVARTEDESSFLGHSYSFFFDAVKPGQYTMSVVGFGWSRSLGEFEVPLAGNPLFRHISLRDIGL